MRTSSIKKKRTVMHNYSREDLIKLGMPTPVVQGLQAMTDINQIMKKIGPTQLAQMKLEQEKFVSRYGTQETLTARDIFLKTQGEKVEFSKLPAEVREYYKNDIFTFTDSMEFNKNNPYYLREILAHVTNNEDYKRKIEHQKKVDAQKQQQEDLKENRIADKIAKAIKKETTNTTK